MGATCAWPHTLSQTEDPLGRLPGSFSLAANALYDVASLDPRSGESSLAASSALVSDVPGVVTALADSNPSSLITKSACLESASY